MSGSRLAVDFNDSVVTTELQYKKCHRCPTGFKQLLYIATNGILWGLEFYKLIDRSNDVVKRTRGERALKA